VPRPDGADISHYQDEPHRRWDDIDWRLFRSGINDPGWFAAKATQGAGYRDPTMPSFRKAAKMAGFRWRLLYHWLIPGATVEGQVRNFLDAVGPLDVGEGVMLDAEEDGITEAMCVEWCQRVEAITGRPVAVYTGVFVAGGSLWRSPRLFDGWRPRVLAAYTSEARAQALALPYRWDAWQWTGTGRLPGIVGDVDVDQVDRPEPFDRACGLDKPVPLPDPPAEVPDETDEDDDMARIPPYIARHPNRKARFLVAPEAAAVRWIVSPADMAAQQFLGLGLVDLDDVGHDRFCELAGVPAELRD
jgi:lysozyme